MHGSIEIGLLTAWRTSNLSQQIDELEVDVSVERQAAGQGVQQSTQFQRRQFCNEKTVTFQWHRTSTTWDQLVDDARASPSYIMPIQERRLKTWKVQGLTRSLQAQRPDALTMFFEFTVDGRSKSHWEPESIRAAGFKALHNYSKLIRGMERP